MEINLIRRISWSFNKTTGLPYEDLFSEASLHYAIAMKKWDGSSCKFTTYAYTLMKNGLIDYCAKQQNNNISDYLIEDAPYQLHFQDTVEFIDTLMKNTESIRTICFIVFEAQEEFAGLSPKITRGIIVDQLREKGWSWGRIWGSFKELKLFLCLNQPGGARLSVGAGATMSVCEGVEGPNCIATGATV